ncbi:hypothetical protein [Lactobacillus delbrueckii]|uniref:hypothetical protein n=1 Tax=Lactobacillus delbrueckii TaxID=1584 RepID=UPI001E346B62|nr:hypothetical protein [Lactobacillus delbrueckii]MCD5445449.1 hypothetical protein [Lactobacillus delbrueckii subsp. lactis]
MHFIVGLDLIVIGLTLMANNRYFFWPPHPKIITDILNDDLVGAIGMLTGIGLIWWAYSKAKSVKADHRLITTATGYYTILSMTEFSHALFSPLGEPHTLMSGIGELVMALVTLYMAKQSPSGEEGDRTKKG